MYNNNPAIAKKLLSQYDEDSAEWDYNKAMFLYMTAGVTMESKSALRKAFKSNRFVPLILLGNVNIPQNSNYITPGEPDEANSYARLSGSLWSRNRGAVVWLVTEIRGIHEGLGEDTWKIIWPVIAQ